MKIKLHMSICVYKEVHLLILWDKGLLDIIIPLYLVTRSHTSARNGSSSMFAQRVLLCLFMPMKSPRPVNIMCSNLLLMSKAGLLGEDPTSGGRLRGSGSRGHVHCI